ncbi:hypothetical protein DSL72_000483 [Monilinia vaccinii-corymbosi]|uniref:Uncharacterized protein n=1 Tax=Monilinia vaccinii-corymbosi TaxID=61207 RepID=A0A8A3NZ36_9HELO|nr:hypothetical protein DSL72_000483 [Monilinia vaccinii-corymbosi]
MAEPPIPWSTRPVLSRLETNMPSLKERMIAKLVESTCVTNAEALRVYDGVRNRTEDACALNKMGRLCTGASESVLTFITDKLFWQGHWPGQTYPREDWLMTPNDAYIIHMACSRMRAHQSFRDSYTREARAWSKSLGERLACMVERP